MEMTYFIVETDTMTHFWTGLIVCAMLSVLFYSINMGRIGAGITAFLVTVICGSLKEVMWDDILRLGSIEYSDWIMTITGALVICTAWFFSAPRTTAAKARSAAGAAGIDGTDAVSEIFPAVVKQESQTATNEKEDSANDEKDYPYIIHIAACDAGESIQRVADADRDRRGPGQDLLGRIAA